MDKVVVKEQNPSVNWLEYFTSIQEQCPWSLDAYQRGLLDIVYWSGQSQSLISFSARMYIVENTDIDIEQIARDLDHGVDTWLWSQPGYGPWATPVPVLIQQNRAELTRLRNKLHK